MNPSIHLRIDSVIRALTDVALPAVHADDRATEQLQLSVAHLGVIRDQLDTAMLFERFELTGYERLATTLVEAVEHHHFGADRLLQSASRELAETLHTHHGFDPADVRERTDNLGRAIEKMVLASADAADEDLRSAVMTAVLRAERRRVDANRAVFLGMGWEPGDELPDITTVVSTSVSGPTMDEPDVAGQPVQAR